jgi:hypothetical protein
LLLLKAALNLRDWLLMLMQWENIPLYSHFAHVCAIPKTWFTGLERCLFKEKKGSHRLQATELTSGSQKIYCFVLHRFYFGVLVLLF